MFGRSISFHSYERADQIFGSVNWFEKEIPVVVQVEPLGKSDDELPILVCRLCLRVGIVKGSIEEFQNRANEA